MEQTDVKYYELDSNGNQVIINGEVSYVSDDMFELLFQLSEQRDQAMRVIDRLQKGIDEYIFKNQMN